MSFMKVRNCSKSFMDDLYVNFVQKVKVKVALDNREEGLRFHR